DLWGRVRSDVAAASEATLATALDSEFARQSLAASVGEAWFLAIEARRQLAIDLDRLEAERSTAEITRDRVAAGVGTQLEAELVEANVAIATAAVRRDEAAIVELVKALEALLGRYPAAELAVAEELPAVPGPVATGVPSALLARRPDIAAADRRVAAAFHLRESARAAQLPQLMLTGSLGTLLDPSESIWSIGANLLAPIFVGGRLQAQVEIATAQQRQALAQYVAVAIAAFREVETALANEQYLALRQAELEKAVVRSRNASRIAEDRYEAGIISIIDLMVIRRQDFETRSILLLVRTDRLRQRLTLYRALGGSFNQERAALQPPE
ncbi:MAG: TolC family protein, partial [Planctomycetota bacterium]